MDLKPPMPVGRTLTDAAKGVAEGHKILVHHSKSEIGQLVVKTAKISMDLDLSSYHDETGFTLSLQPAFFAGLSGTEQKVTQHLTVVMDIVNVMADSKHVLADQSVLHTSGTNIGPPISPGPPAHTDALSTFKNALQKLTAHVSKMQDAERAAILMGEIKQVEGKLDAYDLPAAAAMLGLMLANDKELLAWLR